MKTRHNEICYACKKKIHRGETCYCDENKARTEFDYLCEECKHAIDHYANMYVVRCAACKATILTTEKYVEIIDKCPKCGGSIISEKYKDFVGKNKKNDVIYRDETET